MENTALILEGGGMRGSFSAGVLDFFMEKGLRINDVYGVSAGACLACSYLCGQIGRGLRVWTDYIDDKRYCSLDSLLTTGDLFGAEMNYNIIPFELDPLDCDAYARGGARLRAVVTNLETGRAEYPLVKDMRRDIELIRASASLPLISNIVPIGDRPCLDGGIADSIPIRQSLADGFTRNVIVLTQAEGYRKSPNRLMPLIRLKYRRYPKFVEAMRTRHERYNEALRLAEMEMQAGRAFIIRPDEAPDVGRVEKHAEKLRALHDTGYAIAKREYDRLMAFLNA